MHPRRRTRYGLVIALLGLVASLFVRLPAAEASSTILCKGFTACANAGYSSFGYGPTNYKKMWWRMYAGHNCTNYMAYRMIKAGLPVERPWSGSGDARNWGVVFKSKVNQTPMIGSVAWWSSNHVAYVQRIIDADTIVISEDHYGGDFDWRKITRAGGGWPTGFIHLADEVLTATSPPEVTGTPKVDEPLAVKPGSWNRTGTTYTYQWLAGGAPIAGATGTSYTPTADQVGDTFTVKVTASKAGFRSGAATSPATPATAPGTMVPAASPTLSGVPKVGAVLVAALPAIDPQPGTMKYGWFADGKYISGVTGTSLSLQPAHLGKVIRFVVRSSRAGYDDLLSRSAPTAEVGPEKLAVTREPGLVGNPYVGRPYTVRAGEVTPEAETSYQWLANGVAIPGATAATYTPGLGDPGVRLSLRVAYTRDGYTTIERVLSAPQPIRSLARVYVRSTARKTVTVHVLGDGVPVVKGQVTLIARNGSRRTLTLQDGTATFAMSWLYTGTRTYTVSYLGSPKVAARTRVVTIEVK
ncbi:MAG: hypothetical protein NTV23_03430 [Propionibacteriales bacterium]|nr:hypothetical protein [Propionibacteriales bacterium]